MKVSRQRSTSPPVQKLAGCVALSLGWIDSSLQTQSKRRFPKFNDPTKWRSADPGGEHKKRTVMEVNPLAAEEEYA